MLAPSVRLRSGNLTYSLMFVVALLRLVPCSNETAQRLDVRPQARPFAGSKSLAPGSDLMQLQLSADGVSILLHGINESAGDKMRRQGAALIAARGVTAAHALI